MYLLDGFKEFRVGYFNVPRQIPAEMDHRYYTLVTLEFVPLVSLDAKLVLSSSERSHIPGYIVTPANCLYPVDASGIKNMNLVKLLEQKLLNNERCNIRNYLNYYRSKLLSEERKY